MSVLKKRDYFFFFKKLASKNKIIQIKMKKSILWCSTKQIPGTGLCTNLCQEFADYSITSTLHNTISNEFFFIEHWDYMHTTQLYIHISIITRKWPSPPHPVLVNMYSCELSGFTVLAKLTCRWPAGTNKQTCWWLSQHILPVPKD